MRSRANLTRTMAEKLHPRLKMIDDDVFQAGMNLGAFFRDRNQMEQGVGFGLGIFKKNPKPTNQGKVYFVKR